MGTHKKHSRGTSNEYPHVFIEKKKNIHSFWTEILDFWIDYKGLFSPLKDIVSFKQLGPSLVIFSSDQGTGDSSMYCIVWGKIPCPIVIIGVQDSS